MKRKISYRQGQKVVVQLWKCPENAGIIIDVTNLLLQGTEGVSVHVADLSIIVFPVVYATSIPYSFVHYTGSHNNMAPKDSYGS
jgi:hypothetical protein